MTCDSSKVSARLAMALLVLMLAAACAQPAGTGAPPEAVLTVLEPAAAEALPLRMAVDADQLARAGVIALPPFPQVRRTEAEVRDGLTRWAGTTPDGQRVFLTARGRTLSGLACGGRTNWLYRQVRGDLVAADEVDPSRLPGCGVQAAPEPLEPGSEAAGAEIDLLVLYTERAAPPDPRLEAEVQALAAASAFADSGAPVRFRIADCRTVAFPESGSSATDLALLRDDPRWEALRREVEADQVTLVVSGFRDGNGGLSYLLARREGFRALAVVQRPSLADLTLPHELAHNLGCGHETAGPGLASYARAFVDPQGRFRTLDAQGGLPQPRIPRLSSAATPWDGRPTGSAEADNARVVRANAGFVAGLGQPAPRVPWALLAALALLVLLLRSRR